MTFPRSREQQAASSFIDRSCGKNAQEKKEVFPKCNNGKGMTTQIVWISPDWAESHLAIPFPADCFFRPISGSHVRKMEWSLRRGYFSLTGEPIILNSDGSVRNGRHRLSAVVSTGIGYFSLVVIYDGAQPRDEVKTRRCTDALRTNGYSNCSTLAASARILAMYEQGHQLAGISMNGDRTLEIVKQNPGLVASSAASKSICGMKFRYGAGATCHFLFSKKDPALADRLFSQLRTGADLGLGHPILGLRSWFIAQTNMIREEVAFAVLVHTWNLLRAKKKFGKFAFDIDAPIEDIL